jgi:hypothetical protein
MRTQPNKYRGVRKYYVMVCLSIALLGQVTLGLSMNGSPWQAKGLALGKGRLSREEVRVAERQLAKLGYWTGKVDGLLDTASRHALVAFQKAEERDRSGKLTREEFAAILRAEPPLPRERHYAHVEVDLRRQIMFRVDDAGKVSHILPISSGNEELFTSEEYTRRAVTPVGRFTVYYKIEGWRRSPIGELYYPNYIVGGVAIHGSPSVPTRPDSHGCIRIPMFAAEEFSRLTPIGIPVVVYQGPPAIDVP